MSHNPKERSQLIHAIARGAKASPLADAKAFLNQYYQGVDPDDLAQRDTKILLKTAEAHFKLGQKRRADEDLVRVFNPNLKGDGFQSTNTLVMVTCNDRPFLVDSLSMAITRLGFGIHLIIHPVLSVERQRNGQFAGLSSGTTATNESWQVFEIDYEISQSRLSELELALVEVLKEVRLSVDDWQAMRQRLFESISDPRHHLSEAQKEFLTWMHADHFTFIGARDYQLKSGTHQDQLLADATSGLGILRDAPTHARLISGFSRDQVRAPNSLIITKTNAWSRVHRHSHLDYVGLKIFNKKGHVIGERRFLGLWTSTAYHQNVMSIPLLSEKARHIIDHFGLSSQSHDGKAVSHVLETFPRDELLQASADELIPTIRGVVNLYDRRITRVFGRRDPFGRFWSLLIFIPRDRYNTEVRQRVEDLIRRQLNALDIQSQIELSDSPLARLYLIVRGDVHHAPLDFPTLESQLAREILGWRDQLRDIMQSKFFVVAERGSRIVGDDGILNRYLQAFPAAYRAENTPEQALVDVEGLEFLRQSTERFSLSLKQALESPNALSLRVLSRHEPLAISDTLPALENFGLKLVNEHPYKIVTPEDGVFWIQDLNLLLNVNVSGSIEHSTSKLLQAIRAVWLNQMDNDPLNRLVLAADLDWRECVLMRAACRWLVQIGLPYSIPYMAKVLETYAALSQHIAKLFIARHNPALSSAERATQQSQHQSAIDAGIATLARLDEDRIFSGVRDVLQATVRTNFFQTDARGEAKPYLSLKIDSAKVNGVPDPKPRFEIWVHSPSVEGVHLRKGPVARGGIRWSDRYEDFRTEILGLVKAQHVKNTLIVPVGAKGGFVCRQLPPHRDAQAATVKSCYQTFIRGLLDLTDNIVNRKIAPPKQLVRLDGDDPYLVVAADKGTASFSDTANALALEYDFWLGDAFASGGSQGYDHKKMAITARGAWECVCRHFRERGKIVGKDVIRVVGIGDMSGDVFGNGLLYTDQMQLVAAFNHQHIFIDPNPDPVKSFKERQRLFNLPRSTWEDYNVKLISSGGGIYNRSEKSLKLSVEARKMLGIEQSALTPNELIQALLRLNVDLLWNGGIGTYVKASSESHADVGDRTNDLVRINGSELKALVVGEGGNLGFTQLGRIEAAQHGVALNTDFIDNSAGVNCSDVEVNIKILLKLAAEQSGLKTAQRDALLVSMTDDVSKLVLRNNYLQSQAISILEQDATSQLTQHAYALTILETQGELVRSLEFMPQIAELQNRAKRGQGLSRPELAVLVSYSKIWLYNHLIHSDIPEDPALAHELTRYFPTLLQKRYSALMPQHPLKREIITTATVNSLTHRMGPVFAIQTSEDTGHDLAMVTRAYIIARDAVRMRDCWGRIDALDLKIAAQTQYQMLASSTLAIAKATHWLLSYEKGIQSIADTLKRLQPSLEEFFAQLPNVLIGSPRSQTEAHIKTLVNANVPQALASEIAHLKWMTCGLHIVQLAQKTRQTIGTVAKTYFGVGEKLALDVLFDRIDSLPAEHHWAEVARDGLNEESLKLQADITALILKSARSTKVDQADLWMQNQTTAVKHFSRVINDLRQLPMADFATLSIAVKSLRSLTHEP